MNRENKSKEEEIKEYCEDIDRKLNYLYIYRSITIIVMSTLMLCLIQQYGYFERFFQEIYLNLRIVGYDMSNHIELYTYIYFALYFLFNIFLIIFTNKLKLKILSFTFNKYSYSCHFYDMIEEFYYRIKKEKIINLSFFIISYILIFSIFKIIAIKNIFYTPSFM